MSRYYKPQMMGSESYIVPHWFISHVDVSTNEAFLYAIIRNLLDGEAFDGNSTRDEAGCYLLDPYPKLAIIMGLSNRSIHRILQSMKAHGLVEVENEVYGKGKSIVKLRLIDVD